MDIKNDMIKEYFEGQIKETQALEPLIMTLDRGEIPQTLRIDEKDARWFLGVPETLPSSVIGIKQDRGMYASVTKIFCQSIAEWGKGKKFLDVMAGRGWLVKGLQEEGLTVHGTDDFSWFNKMGWYRLDDVKIERLDAIDSVVKYGSDYDVVILSWPPYEDDVDCKIVKKLFEVNPDAMILYIGESVGGCTGSDEFFNIIEEIEDETFEPVYFSYETVRGISDKPYLFKLAGNDK